MDLLLVRHGETDFNKEARVLGHTDCPLNHVGRSQAKAVAVALEKRQIHSICASPLVRALETARDIAAKKGLEIEVTDGLKEADAGALDGLKVEEMHSKYPEFVKNWKEDIGNTHMPGGESLVQVQQRAWKATTDLFLRHPKDTVVAVTHNFTIICIICKALDLPISYFRKFDLDLGSITSIRLNTPKEVVLESLNERRHLEA
jgi:broad specificity phosphatase PhoE